MGIRLLAVSGYRSLQDVVLPLDQLTLVSGVNGSGKSNLYRALRLILAAARGDLVGVLAREGGLPAVMWAGPERLSREMRQGERPVQGGPRQQPVRLRLGLAADPFSYAIELGYTQDPQSAFALDPALKGEWIWAGGRFHPRAVLSQSRGQCDPDRSLFQSGADPQQQPEVHALREEILAWRFYDSFRTDSAAPARQPRVGTRCFALAGDGGDLPAAVQTILESGDGKGLQEAIADAFPGCRLSVSTDAGVFRLNLHQPGLLRPLEASELSDGTLRYVLLTVALFSPRLPPLLVLNEPESSLHPDLLPPLARLIGSAADRTQVWVIAHAPALIDALAGLAICRHVQLERELGATRVHGQTTLERGAWRWP
ncbi:ATP-binding protein [Synechococcus sp. RSCCF101]|uniref:AAA family ATPase n=1 Tax=Synechococcus sp. RSCCF101 TaxID=2511069 RepID=UPI001246CDBB|nr:AAA family ATPase [Synechococcus sp. RSCCF101]QEY31449.1 ATP-binding protein [Synechococcus sp. RSCCF101]